MNDLLELTKPITLDDESDFDLLQNQEVNPYMSYFPIALDNYIEIKSRIQEFANLLENCEDSSPDSYNTSATAASIISSEVISNAESFIEQLPPAILSKLSVSDITPTNYGTIVFDWYDSRENFVSIEVGKTKIGGFYEFNGKSSPLSEERVVDTLADASENFKFLNKINCLYRSQFEVNA